uniref:Uncharacterized protein n=1 Tax=Anguilla anguilla TaxID=7936 RepID=A0A0E9PQP5_ANGAN
MGHQDIHKRVESMPARVHAVIKAKGGHAKYEDILKFMYIFQKFNFSLKLLS